MNRSGTQSKTAAERGRWSSRRKTEVVLRILRGEALDALSRDASTPRSPPGGPKATYRPACRTCPPAPAAPGRAQSLPLLRGAGDAVLLLSRIGRGDT